SILRRDSALDSSVRREPLGMCRVAAAHHVELALLEATSNRTKAAVADGPVIDLSDRRHLGGGACQEHLVGQPQLVASAALLSDGETHLSCQDHDGVTRDSWENRCRQR